MAGKITIREDVCKGCDLCVFVCPKKIIAIERKSSFSLSDAIRYFKLTVP